MTDKLIEAVPDVPRKRIWKPWKWIGLIVYALALLFGRWLPGPVVAAAYIYGVIVAANLLFHLMRYLASRVFWRVRNRLIGAFIFVGVIPLLILLGVVYLTGYVLFGQLTGRYLEGSLREIEHELGSINAELAGESVSARSEAEWNRQVESVVSKHRDRFPALAARLLKENAEGQFAVVLKFDPAKLETDGEFHPGSRWLDGKREFEGLVRKDDELLLASLRPVPGPDRRYLALTAPLDRAFEDRLSKERSIYASILGVGRTAVIQTDTSIGITLKGDGGIPTAGENENLVRMQSKRAGDPRRMVTWYLALSGKGYDTGKDDYVGIAVVMAPWATVYKYSIGEGDLQGRVLIVMIYVLGGMFLFTEVVSLLFGFTLSRRITRSVHDMYQGTLALQKGDLQYKIPVRRKDQLGMLAHSFNEMSGAITRLLDEVSEKKRLEQELEIAREVQATLFPKQLPTPRGMALFGGCEPARVVSGDYYDFVVEDESRLDIVVADISGKGISAALLMANLQAAMRNQLLHLKDGNPEELEKRLAEVVGQLNEQIYLNSPAEKYATLFIGRFDASTRKFCYCNAGHLPPILLNRQGERMLEATGMVVGLFPGASYEARSIELEPGSLLAIFTDGVTEAVNKDEEEFGETRLMEALRKARGRSPEAIYRFVVERIREWQGNLPQHDDITLIVAAAG